MSVWITVGEAALVPLLVALVDPAMHIALVRALSKQQIPLISPGKQIIINYIISGLLRNYIFLTEVSLLLHKKSFLMMIKILLQTYILMNQTSIKPHQVMILFR